MAIAVDHLAATIVTIAAPFAPYLVEGGKKFAEKAGESAWEQVQKIWACLTSPRDQNTDPSVQLQMLSANPDSAGYRAVLTEALVKHLTKYPELAPELTRLVAQHPRVQEIVAEGERLRTWFRSYQVTGGR